MSNPLKRLPLLIRRVVGLHLLVLWYGGAPVVVILMLAFGSFWPLVLIPLAALGVQLVQINVASMDPPVMESEPEPGPHWEPPAGDWDGGDWKRTVSPEGTIAFEWTDEDAPPPATPGKEESERVAFLRRRLDEEIRARMEARAMVLDGPASARITGRVARIEMKSEDAATRTLFLAVEDEGGEYQVIRARAASADVVQVTETDQVTIACGWRYGRLVVTEVEARSACQDLMPEVQLPEPKGKADSRDGKLPNMDELNEQTKGDGWGSLNHSKYRCPIAWHLTTSPKCRRKSFEGKATEVQAILREVAEAEGLRVVAVAAEPDHIHLLGIPAGMGGMPPTWTWSRWIGRWKALCSKRLKALPGLEEFEWQVGYALTSVNGGKQGAEEALEVVRQYVESQGDQDDQEGASEHPDEESKVSK